MENSLHTGWNKGLNNKINHINETALHIVYEDYSSSFEDLFIKDKSVTIRQRNLQQLTIEMFKRNSSDNYERNAYLCRKQNSLIQFKTI